MARRTEFSATAELLEYLQNAFTRSAWCDVFGPEMLSEKKRSAFSKTISACANAGGGNYYIGGKAKGKRFSELMPVSQNDARYIEQLIYQNVFPEISGLVIRFFPLENQSEKGIIHLFIPDSLSKPFMASDYRYYVRNGLREQLMEEYQVRNLYKAAASSDMELAGIINTNGIPEYSDGRLCEIRFYPKFLIRNRGNAPSGIFKFELLVPSDLHDTSYTPLQNYFNRLEGPYTVFSFPSGSTVFQGETIAVAEAKFHIKPENISTYLKHDIRINLYSEQGVQNYSFRFSETFTIDNRPLTIEIFKTVKTLK